MVRLMDGGEPHYRQEEHYPDTPHYYLTQITGAVPLLGGLDHQAPVLLVRLVADAQPAVEAEDQEVGGEETHLRASPPQPGDLAGAKSEETRTGINHLISGQVRHHAVYPGGPPESHRLDTPVGPGLEEERPDRRGRARHRPRHRPLALRARAAELQPEVPLEAGIVNVALEDPLEIITRSGRREGTLDAAEQN